MSSTRTPPCISYRRPAFIELYSSGSVETRYRSTIFDRESLDGCGRKRSQGRGVIDPARDQGFDNDVRAANDDGLRIETFVLEKTLVHRNFNRKSVMLGDVEPMRIFLSLRSNGWRNQQQEQESDKAGLLLGNCLHG